MNKFKKKQCECFMCSLVGISMTMAIGMLMVLVPLLLSSCGTTKHITKETTKDQVTADTRTVSTTTTTEQATGSVTTCADTISAQEPLFKLEQGDSLVEETPTQELVVKLDKKGVLHARAIKKAEILPFLVNKTSVTSSTATEHEEEKTITTTQVKDTQRPGLFSQIDLNYGWLLLSGVGIIWFIFFLWKRRKKSPES